MQITLPTWKPEYEPRASEGGYNRLLDELRPLLNRALQLYEAYLRTGNDLLYETFREVAFKMYPKFHLLAIIGDWRELHEKSKALQKAAEIVSGADELPCKATFLYDLAGAVRGR